MPHRMWDLLLSGMSGQKFTYLLAQWRYLSFSENLFTHEFCLQDGGRVRQSRLVQTGWNRFSRNRLIARHRSKKTTALPPSRRRPRPKAKKIMHRTIANTEIKFNRATKIYVGLPAQCNPCVVDRVARRFATPAARGTEVSPCARQSVC